MRKKIVLLFIILISIFCVAKAFEKDDEIRVRVIPNSNSETDLVIKKEVQQLTVSYLEKCFCRNGERFKENIIESIDEFNVLLEKYDAISSLEKHTFYSKAYNGSSVKDDTTLTFLVKIGDALRDNWWGVIYPEFLEVSSSEEVIYRSFIKEMIDKVFN